MGTKLCSCGDDNNINSKLNNRPITETNLSNIEKYSQLKQSKNIRDLNEEFRTKAGAEWDKLIGLEKIITIYKINYIIKRYREHLNRKKKKENNDT